MSDKTMREIAKVQEAENKKLEKILTDGESACYHIAIKSSEKNIDDIRYKTIEQLKKQAMLFA